MNKKNSIEFVKKLLCIICLACIAFGGYAQGSQRNFRPKSLSRKDNGLPEVQCRIQNIRKITMIFWW